MSDVLVRGLTPRVHKQIQQFAESQNLSVNQVLVQFIREAVEEMEKRRKKEKGGQEAFRRIREIREEIHQKYGPFEDSTRWIREDRERH